MIQHGMCKNSDYVLLLRSNQSNPIIGDLAELVNGYCEEGGSTSKEDDISNNSNSMSALVSPKSPSVIVTSPNPFTMGSLNVSDKETEV